MEALQLIMPFGDEQVQQQRFGDVDAPEFHGKELRIKNLHKNMCKKPEAYSRQLSFRQHSSPNFEVSPRPRSSGASKPIELQKKRPSGSAGKPIERHKKLQPPPPSPDVEDAEYDTSDDDDGLQRIPFSRRFPDPRTKSSPVIEKKRPSKSSAKRRARLPAHPPRRLSDSHSSEFPENDRRYYKRVGGGGTQAKVKHNRAPTKGDDVEPKPSRTEFFDVPIETYEPPVQQCYDAAITSCRRGSSTLTDSSPRTPSQRRPPSRPLKKQSRRSPPASQRRPASKPSMVSLNYDECMEISSDSEACEGPSQIPVRDAKWSNDSPDVSTEEEIFPLEMKFRTPAVKLKAKNGRPVEGKLEEKKNKTVDSHKFPVAEKEKTPITRKKRGPHIRKLKCRYTTEDTSSEVEPDDTKYPTFLVEMKHSNVITCFWLGIPVQFCHKHMPAEDQFIVLQDAMGLKWETNFLARKNGLSGGWRRFALDHGLEMRDIAVFELVKPLKFRVHIRRSSGTGRAIVTAHQFERKPPKNVAEQRLATARLSSLDSALNSERKRLNRDDSQAQAPSKKRHLASSQDHQQEGWMTLSTKPDSLVDSEQYKTDGSLARNEVMTGQISSWHKGDPYEDDDIQSISDGSRSDGEEEPGTPRAMSQRHLSSTVDAKREPSNIQKTQEWGLTIYSSSVELQQPEPLCSKPAPKIKKPRRLIHIETSSSSEDDFTSNLEADSG